MNWPAILFWTTLITGLTCVAIGLYLTYRRREERTSE